MSRHERQMINARTKAQGAGSRNSTRLRSERDALATALAEAVARFTHTGGHQYTASATTADLERWKTALDQTDN